MSAFLWVKNFEYEKENDKDCSHELFGSILPENSDELPRGRRKLISFLKENQIYLVTNFAEAKRFIAESLDKVDSIILDGDLELSGGDPELVQKYVYPVLEKIYGKSNPESQEYIDLKLKAGYHIVIDLMEKSFPKESIIFYTTHTDRLEYTLKAFNNAGIDPPARYDGKAIEDASRWIKEQRDKPYTKLRRLVIGATEEILSRLQHDYSKISLVPSCIKDGNNRKPPTVGSPKYWEKGFFEDSNGELEKLEKDKAKEMYRKFLRELTKLWDSTKIRNYHFTEEIGKKGYWTLLNIRNLLNHDPSAERLTDLNEGDVAFFFMLAMRSLFSLDKNLEKFEEELMILIGDKENLDMSDLKDKYNRTWNEIDEKFHSNWDAIAKLQNAPKDKKEYKHFSTRVNVLMRLKDSPLKGEEVKRLYQIFFHSLHQRNQWGDFDLQPRHFQKKGQFIEELTQRCQHRAFD